MKTSLLLLLGLASLGGTTVHAQNLLKNPSYEEVGTSNDTAANWYRWGDWLNREDSWSPTHSGTCLIGYHHWQITGDANSGMWQDVTNVKAGQKFKFSVFVSADAPDGGAESAASVELRLEAIRGGKELQIESAKTNVSDLIKSAGWHELSVSGTTPATGGPRGGAVKIDDAKLELAK